MIILPASANGLSVGVFPLAPWTGFEVENHVASFELDGALPRVPRLGRKVNLVLLERCEFGFFVDHEKPDVGQELQSCRHVVVELWQLLDVEALLRL